MFEQWNCHTHFPLDDGILRVYDLSTFKVIKAVRNLDSEISSIICVKKPSSDLRDAWIAAGTRVRAMLCCITR